MICFGLFPFPLENRNDKKSYQTFFCLLTVLETSRRLVHIDGLLLGDQKYFSFLSSQILKYLEHNVVLNVSDFGAFELQVSRLGMLNLYDVIKYWEETGLWT